MEREILACIDEKNVNYLQSGQISKYIFPMGRKKAHENKVSHIIIRFFVMAITPDNKIQYLVQKRGKNKRSFHGYFTDSASGHVIYKKNLNLNDIKKNAIRELEEEFGIPPKAIQKKIFYDLNVEKDNFTTEIAYIFFGLIDYNVNLTPNPSELEVNGSRFYKREELQDLLENEKFVDYSKKIWKKLLSTDITTFFKKKSNLKEEKKNKIALFIGRFQPLHFGHLHVIKSILKSHDKIKIGIGSSQLSRAKNDPFTGEERRQFIKVALEKRKISPNRYEIFDIPDIFNATKWVDHVLSIVGEFDVIFSNSDWVRNLFRNKDYEVGKKITIFKNKFNASNVRNLIYRNDKSWINLVPNEVVLLIKKFKGIERIKSLH
ncbi:MAG: nicotinamide-nucleotide adenylyltransferase [Promethearchaeota archaeon]